MAKVYPNVRKVPPKRSANIISDVAYFLIHTPLEKTLIKFKNAEKRQEYNQRVCQRVGIDVEKNSILNVHQIGVDAPVNYVFKELLDWNGDSTCWPNHIAKVHRIDNNLKNIEILPFGWEKYPFGIKKNFLGLNFIPLFKLNSIRFKETPDAFDFDNARYLLFKCSGGYPIGIFIMYVRSSIPELGETEKSQLVFAVSFNFFGKEKIKASKFTNAIWKMLHNRVTSNVLNKMKQLSEWRLEKMENSL